MAFDLNLSEDQRQILAAANAMLTDAFPLGRTETDTEDLSAAFAFGLPGLALPEEHGGAGFGLVEEALVHTQIGRHLGPLGTITAPLAARLALHDGDQGLADEILNGERFIPAAIPFGDGALTVWGNTTSPTLILGDTLSLQVTTGVETLDALAHGGTMTRLALSKTIIKANPGHRLIADLLVSAHLVGIAQATRDLAADYAATRRQFGKPIGAFQAIKHHAANMTLGVEMLSAQLDMAALALADNRSDAGFQVAALGRIAPRIALRNARLSIQIHGGIGFSEEAAAHRYLKRAHTLRHMLSTSDLLSETAPLAPFAKGFQ